MQFQKIRNMDTNHIKVMKEGFSDIPVEMTM